MHKIELPVKISILILVDGIFQQQFSRHTIVPLHDNSGSSSQSEYEMTENPSKHRNTKQLINILQ